MLLLFLYKLSTQWMQIITYTIRKVLLLLQLDNYSIDESIKMSIKGRTFTDDWAIFLELCGKSSTQQLHSSWFVHQYTMGGMKG